MPITCLKALDLRDKLEAAEPMVRCAAFRNESRGAHYRKDFPQTNDADFKKMSVYSIQSGVELWPIDMAEYHWGMSSKKNQFTQLTVIKKEWDSSHTRQFEQAI